MKQQQRTVVLVLEDEKPLYEVIKAKLETEGFIVVVAKSVHQALEYLQDGVAVNVIWLDHYLFGKEDGLDFVNKIKQKGSAWKNIPIVVVSNTVSPEKVQAYLKLGVQKCYSKVDFTLGHIIANMKKLLK